MPQAALLVIVACALLLSIAAPHTNPLLPATLQPLAPSTGMTGLLAPLSFHLAFGWVIVNLLLMCAGYAIVVAFARELSVRVVLGAIVALNVLTVLGPPLFSTDVFSYQAYARMFVIYHINPYTNGPYTMGTMDPVYHYIGAMWIGTPTVYGPVFTALTGLLAHARIATSELVFRLIAMLSSLGTVALLWASARRRKLDPIPAIALFGLNPLVFLYGVGGAHNDLLMVALSAAGVYAALRAQTTSSGGLFALSAGVKLTSAVIAPFALLGTASYTGRRRFVVGLLATAAAIMGLGLGLFGSGSLHLLGTITSNQGTRTSQSIPGLISIVFGAGAWDVARIALPVVGAVIIVHLLLSVWRGKLDWLEATAWAYVTLLFTADSVLPWYGAWMLPLVALCRNRRLWIVALSLTPVIAIVGMVPQIPSGLLH